MARMRPPKLCEAPVDVLADEEIGRLFEVCKGNTFSDRVGYVTGKGDRGRYLPDTDRQGRSRWLGV